MSIIARDNIIQMAREAGISDVYFDFQMVSPEDLARFATLVAAARREECAALCDRFAVRDMHPAECASAIRKMGGA